MCVCVCVFVDRGNITPFRIYAKFFFNFFTYTKNSATDSQKSRYPSPHPPPDRPLQRKYGSHRDTTHGGTSWTAHPVPGPAADPGPLILDCLSWTTHPGAQIFPVPGPALFGHTRYGPSIPVALWWILDSVRRCGG